MIRSMTAYTLHEWQTELGVFRWELKSVNHRYLELAVKLPETCRAIETEMRQRLNQKLSRGKVDCFLRFKPAGDLLPEVSLNEEALQRLLALENQVLSASSRAAPATTLALLGWPGILDEQEPDFSNVQAEALKGLDKAVDELVAAREREGGRLRTTIESRLDQIEALGEQVRQRLPVVIAQQEEKIQERLKELKVEVDEARLAQELAILAQKADIAEELDRLQSHVSEVRQVLQSHEPKGRRLDFFMQEFNREANTLGSKSSDKSVTRCSVDLKVLIEQIREQVQNIE